MVFFLVVIHTIEHNNMAELTSPSPPALSPDSSPDSAILMIINNILVSNRMTICWVAIQIPPTTDSSLVFVNAQPGVRIVDFLSPNCEVRGLVPTKSYECALPEMRVGKTCTILLKLSLRESPELLQQKLISASVSTDAQDNAETVDLIVQRRLPSRLTRQVSSIREEKVLASLFGDRWRKFTHFLVSEKPLADWVTILGDSSLWSMVSLAVDLLDSFVIMAIFKKFDIRAVLMQDALGDKYKNPMSLREWNSYILMNMEVPVREAIHKNVKILECLRKLIALCIDDPRIINKFQPCLNKEAS